MAFSSTANGRPQRKQLADQLDRLDVILDGLAEGLNEAVASAVRDGTRLAFKDALTEMMENPTQRTTLYRAAGAEPSSISSNPGLVSSIKAKVSTWAVTAMSNLSAIVLSILLAVTSAAATTRKNLICQLSRACHPLIVGAAAAAVVYFFVPPIIAAAVASIGSGVALMASRISAGTSLLRPSTCRPSRSHGDARRG